ncbi:MAG: acyl carrier protein [Fermentimonas sp.]|nr:acyl carrier protein [Fermentimonas sp.]
MERFLSLVTEVLLLDDTDVKINDNFREYDEWDSLSALSFLAMLNEEYDIVISRREFDDMTTLHDVYRYLCDNVGS